MRQPVMAAGSIRGIGDDAQIPPNIHLLAVQSYFGIYERLAILCWAYRSAEISAPLVPIESPAEKVPEIYGSFEYPRFARYESLRLIVAAVDEDSETNNIEWLPAETALSEIDTKV